MELSKITDKHTLGEAKAALREVYRHGAICPCCKQFVKLYKRKITSSMAAAICLFVRYNDLGQHFHLENFLKQHAATSSMRGDAAKLVYWGLIEKVPGKKEDGNPNLGIYSVTKAGYDFVTAAKLVPKYVYIYNNQLWDIDKKDFVGIHESLGNKFNYSELMYDTVTT